MHCEFCPCVNNADLLCSCGCHFDPDTMRRYQDVKPQSKYACIISRPSASGSRLNLAYRSGDLITYKALDAGVPFYEDARKEAQALLPDRLIVIPMLGEKTP